MTTMELDRWLRDELVGFPCRCALHMTDADTGEVLHSFHADTVVTSASTIKTPVLLAALEQVRLGRLDLSASLPLEASVILPDSEVFEPENLRESYTLWEYLYWMIVESDNTATNVILDLLGFDVINDYITGPLGLTGTACHRKMLDFAAQAAGRDNVTTAADQCRVYELLYRKAILTPALVEVALDMLTRQRCMDGFLRYIPYPLTLAHKTGGLDHVDHDAGLFWLENRRFTLAILTWDGPALDEQPQQKRLIGKLTRAICETYR